MGQLIVLAGDHASGKSYITHLTENSTRRVISIHEKDLITIKLCHILNTPPLSLEWGFCKYQYIIDELFQDTEAITYARSSKDMNYIMTNIFGVSDSTITNELLVPNIWKLFQLTDLIQQEWTIDLDTELLRLKFISNIHKHTMIYHAQTISEVQYFKNKNIPTIFVHSDTHFKQHYVDSLDVSSERLTELSDMENLCNYKIINNISLNTILKQKIPNILYMIEQKNFAKYI